MLARQKQSITARLGLGDANVSTGNVLDALHDGDEAYPAMFVAIAAARKAIHCEAYILDPDAVGGRFVRALAERARAGVRVRVLLDAVGCYRLPREWLDYLTAAGAYVHIFNPIRFAPMEMLTKRNHRKLLIVDGTVAFTGGMNLSADHIKPPLGKGWRDCIVCVRGPAVNDMDAEFIRSYVNVRSADEPSGSDLFIRSHPARTAGDAGRVHVLANALFTRRYTIRNAYVRAIDRARSEVFLAHSYFVPDRRIRAALKRARRRGVRVRLMLPGVSDVPIVKRAMESLYDRWLSLGMEIREWPGPMMHLKIGLFDGAAMTCGSYNLDDRSLRKNLELSLWITRSDVAAEMHRRLDADWQKCHEVTRQEWHARTFLQRVREWIAFRLRKRM